MQHQYWEYRFVLYRAVPGLGSGLRLYSDNAEKLKDEFLMGKTPSISEYSNSLAAQGWELAFFEAAQNLTFAYAVFKRPREP